METLCLLILSLGTILAQQQNNINESTILSQLRNIKVSVSTDLTVQIADNKISPIAKLNWTYHNVPTDFTLDGVLLFFGENQKHSLIPIDSCNSGNESIWVRNIEDEQSCQKSLLKEKSCGELSLNKYCLCFTENCTYIDGDSRKTTKLFATVKQISGIPVSYPIKSHEASFEVNFHRHYSYKFNPYYRHHIIFQHAAANAFDESLQSCAMLVMKSDASYGLQNAITACCENEIKQYSAFNISIDTIIPDFSTNSFNVTATWLEDPEYSQNITGYFPKIVQYSPGTTTPNVVDLESNPRTATSLVDCFNRTIYKASAKFNGLRAGETYVIYVTTTFNNASLAKLCSNSRNPRASCNTELKYKMPEIDLCDKKWGYCHEYADCNLTNLNEFPTCQCRKGFTGNGISTNNHYGFPEKYASGCTYLNRCSNKTTRVCSDYAECYDSGINSAVNCTCFGGFVGDGYINGTQCMKTDHLSSSTIAIIAVFVCLFVLIMMAIAVLVYKRFGPKPSPMMIEKQLSEGGIFSYLIEGSGDMNDGPWLPTFGEKWEIPFQAIDLLDVIGRGNYGVVYKGSISFSNPAIMSGQSDVSEISYASVLREEEKFLDKTEAIVAVKMLQEGAQNQGTYLQFLSEIGFMLNLMKHENILLILGCSTTTKDVCLVTEYLEYGDLLHFLWDARDPEFNKLGSVYDLEVVDLIEICRQISCGMQQLSQMRLIHGDLAARNILVGENRVCKISDFGLASDVYRYGHITGKVERSIPVKWASPERLMKGERPITYKSDVWSFGNLMYEVFTLGCSPHHGISADILLQKLEEGYRMKKPALCSDEIYSIMLSCWKMIPSSRPNFKILTKKLKDNEQNQFATPDKETKVEDLDKKEYNEDLNINIPIE